MTTGPDKIGLMLHNDNNTAGGFSPMILFTKTELSVSPFQATMAGIYARAPLGTGNSGSWIDGELIFATAGAATNGIRQRMVINKEGNVGIGEISPNRHLHVCAAHTSIDGLYGQVTVQSTSTIAGIELVNTGGKGMIQTNLACMDFWVDSQTTGNNYVSSTDKIMTLKSGGCVGIGTASPTNFAQLTVQESITCGGLA